MQNIAYSHVFKRAVTLVLITAFTFSAWGNNEPSSEEASTPHTKHDSKTITLSIPIPKDFQQYVAQQIPYSLRDTFNKLSQEKLGLFYALLALRNGEYLEHFTSSSELSDVNDLFSHLLTKIDLKNHTSADTKRNSEQWMIVANIALVSYLGRKYNMGFLSTGIVSLVLWAGYYTIYPKLYNQGQAPTSPESNPENLLNEYHNKTKKIIENYRKVLSNHTIEKLIPGTLQFVEDSPLENIKKEIETHIKNQLGRELKTEIGKALKQEIEKKVVN